MTTENEVARLALRMEELRKQSERLHERTNDLLEQIVQKLVDLAEVTEREGDVYSEEREQP